MRSFSTLGHVLSVGQGKVDFSAAAVLRKRPSLNSQPARQVEWPSPYLVFDGELGECIEQFLAKPPGQRHLYEIHTVAQGEIVGEVMNSDQIVELARKRDDMGFGK